MSEAGEDDTKKKRKRNRPSLKSRKKRKLVAAEAEAAPAQLASAVVVVDDDSATSKKKKKKKKSSSKVLSTSAPASSVSSSASSSSITRPTISICIPASIIENAQSAELRTYLAGQLSRAAAIFCVNEVVVFDDVADPNSKQRSEACQFLDRLLRYLEMPQYLRKTFFPFHRDLRLAGLLQPLDAPHHVRRDEWSRWRDGVTVNRPVKAGQEATWVDVGLSQQVLVDEKLPPQTRVTVEFAEDHELSTLRSGRVVSRECPSGYWGYKTRVARSLSAALTESGYGEPYDWCLGTSERGRAIWPQGWSSSSGAVAGALKVPSFRHAMIAFGGLSGLEQAVTGDPNLTDLAAEDVFDDWVNACPGQGSRTIRTEEAVLVVLSNLAPLLPNML